VVEGRFGMFQGSVRRYTNHRVLKRSWGTATFLGGTCIPKTEGLEDEQRRPTVDDSEMRRENQFEGTLV